MEDESCSVIVAGARTPIGKFGGSFRSLTAVELGGLAVRAALDRAGIAAEEVGYVILGQVLQAGAGQITARQAAIQAGIPQEVPAVTINKVCLSGLNAIAMADQMIRAGELQTVVAGGMESMTQAPYVVPKARFGARMGDVEMIDSMIHDGLWSSFTGQHMGKGSDEVNRELEIGREEQDEWAARSHRRAAAAWDEGRLEVETTAVKVPQQRGEPVLVSRDEGVRPGTTAATLAELAPAFSPGGTITAGNASQISDGAAAVVVMSARRARQLGLQPLAEVVSHGMSAERFTWLHTVPALAMHRALEKAGLRPQDLELVEINEAFAAVALNAARMLGLDEERVNVNGGAVALGHPIGASGARLALTLAHEMRRRGARLGGAALCGGGGQGEALILRNPAA
jgi:acetyl-CoA C-acetyltransferase